MTALRQYQLELYEKTREALRQYRSVCIQLATGGGKTPIIAAICESVFGKNKRVWVIVNRKELIKQTSNHLKKWNVPHGVIAAGVHESRAYNVHVISSDTLIRRWSKIKNWPDVCIIDECHLTIDRQIDIANRLPDYCKIIGMTATPERGDGRGLSKKSGGIYDTLIEGPSIPWLTERGYLAPLRYFSPPLEGLENIKFKGTEADEEQLEELLQRRKVYGQVVDHYEKHGNGKTALIFCRSIKQAEHTAERFRDRGFSFYAISSDTPDAERTKLISDINSGKIQGLCGCDIFIYGTDIPRAEYGATIRPTLSRAVYMQGIGRILRPYPNKISALFFDHVNNILDHQDDNYPGVPLHYADHITWNFDGTEKRKKKKNNNIKLCPYLDYMYCNHVQCATCEHNPDKSVKDARKQMVIVPAELQELKKPVPLSDMSFNERRVLEDEISDEVLKYKADETVLPSVVNKLLTIADNCGYSVFWVYHQLIDDKRHTVHVPILSEICRIKGYKSGWIYFAKQKLKAKAV